LSVRYTNFVHWLSSFCYPDRTTAALLDQMDHPFGYTLRPANKTTYNSHTSIWLVYSLGLRNISSWKTEMSHPVIYLYIRIWKTNSKYRLNNHPFLLRFQMAFHRRFDDAQYSTKIMPWPSSSPQFTAHGSSKICDSFYLSYPVGRVFLHNLTQRNRSRFLHSNKFVDVYSDNIKEGHVRSYYVRKTTPWWQILTFA